MTPPAIAWLRIKVSCAVHDGAGINPLFVAQFKLAGIDLSEIEDVIDDIMEMFTALANEPDVFSLLRL